MGMKAACCRLFTFRGPFLISCHLKLIIVNENPASSFNYQMQRQSPAIDQVSLAEFAMLWKRCVVCGALTTSAIDECGWFSKQTGNQTLSLICNFP
jgi:hypothetical protein